MISSSKKILKKCSWNKYAQVIITVIILSAIFLFYINSLREISFIQDDAYTSLRYVQNYVEGKGLVFNVGEHVEGYTNFLWVMLLSLIAFIQKIVSPQTSLINSLPIATQILSCVSGVSLLLVSYWLSKKIIASDKEKSFENSIQISIPVVFTSISTPFLYWSVSGMETSLFASLTILSIIFCVDIEKGKNKYGFVIVSVLNSLLRPEGVLFFCILIAFMIMKKFNETANHNYRERIKKCFSKDLITILFGFVIPIVVFVGFRLVYYGYPFPNTYYAKTEYSLEFLERGFDYFINFAKQFSLYGILLLPIVFRFITKKTKSSENILLWFTISWLVLVILIGGDVLPINRFYLPLIPIVSILFVNSMIQLLDEFLPNSKRRIIQLIIVLLFVCYSVINYIVLKPEMMEKRAYEVGLVSKMKIYAEFVKKVNNASHSQQGDVKVAMSTIGAFSFYSGVKVIDLVGLTDEYIAHNPKENDGIDEQLPVLWRERHYNAGYTLACKPDYIIFPAGAKPSAFAECAIYLQPEFYKNYFTQLFYSTELQQLIPIFTRKENIHNDSLNCNKSFMKYYLTANNEFLSLLQNKDRRVLNSIIADLDVMIRLCPSRASEAITLKGMAFYHVGNNIIAEKYLSSALESDTTNSTAMFYLMNTYRRRGKMIEAEKQLLKIRKYSPFAFPESL